MIGSLKCQRCIHNLNPNKSASEWKCDAYPQGIPEMKLCFITRDPCENCNNGIGFEPKEKTDELYLVSDDSAEQWKKENPEEYLELERRFQELHKND